MQVTHKAPDHQSQRTVRRAARRWAGSFGEGQVSMHRLQGTRLKHAIGISGLCLLLVWPVGSARAEVPSSATLSVAAVVLDGSNPGIVAGGLLPSEVVRIHVLRSLEKWKEDGGKWQRVRQSLHAYADFTAAADGTVRVDSDAPINGTYMRPDPLALLRTGYRFGDPALKGVRTFPEDPLAAGPEDRVWVKLERAGSIAAEAVFELASEAQGVEVSQEFGDGWHAVYARPAGGSNLPVVISLHGSEGGSIDKARGRAVPFASQGFACVGLNYFAWQHETIKGVPTKLVELELETLESVREWVEKRPEVDATRIHLVGVSKGAELALLAAARFDWITSVVALVPSDVVWEGGDYPAPSTDKSSWTFGGKPLPFVPLFPFDPNQEGLYRTNTERYERSRMFHPDRVGPARIPVEDTKARILLLASDRDEVWASGAMARNIVERMVAAGRSDRVEVKIYPRAGHQIAGTGTFPVRLYGEQSPDPDAKDILAEGEAMADAWRRTLLFLRK